MAIHRAIKQFTDRGSIKDIQDRANNSLEENPELPPTPDELRIKGLYEQAMVTRDQALLDSLGLIVMTGPAKDPVALYRHREYVRSLKEKYAAEVEQSKQELTQCLMQSENEDSYTANQELRRTVYKQAMALAVVLDDSIVKTASAKGSPDNTFRRVK